MGFCVQKKPKYMDVPNVEKTAKKIRLFQVSWIQKLAWNMLTWNCDTWTRRIIYIYDIYIYIFIYDIYMIYMIYIYIYIMICIYIYKYMLLQHEINRGLLDKKTRQSMMCRSPGWRWPQTRRFCSPDPRGWDFLDPARTDSRSDVSRHFGCGLTPQLVRKNRYTDDITVVWYNVIWFHVFTM